MDTNFIISLLKQHRDLETEIKTFVPGPIRIVVPDWIILELERLDRKGSANVRTWANVAISYLAKRKYSIIEHKPGPTDVDASLVELALTEKVPTVIATNDRQLRTVLEMFGLSVMWTRAKYGLLTSLVRS